MESISTASIDPGCNFIILAVGLNNIPHEPAANIIEKLKTLLATMTSYHIVATIPYSPRYVRHFGKIRQVNEFIGKYNEQTTGSRLLLDEPSLAFHRDNLHLHGKSKAIVAEKLSCIFDSFIATLA